jgi:hypothetical protein
MWVPMMIMMATSIMVADAFPRCCLPFPSVAAFTTSNSFSLLSVSMLKKAEDYYQAFGESSSKSYSFPTQGNLDPPVRPLKRFSVPKAQQETKKIPPKPQPNPKILKRYLPKGYVQEEITAAKGAAAVVKSMTTTTITSFLPPSSTRIRFRTDEAGMMMEASCVVPLKRHRTHSIISVPPCEIQQEKSDRNGSVFHATSPSSVPPLNADAPFLPGTINSNTGRDESTAVPTEASTTTTIKPPSTFLEGDVPENHKIFASQDIPQPQPSHPLKQYRSVNFQHDSAGMMLQSPEVVPKPKRILPLTVDQLDVSCSQKNKHIDSSSSYKLDQKSTPPTDQQYYKGLRNGDSGLQGPRQPTLLWEQRPADFTGRNST